MAAVNAAYEVLSNPQLRASYDAELDLLVNDDHSNSSSSLSEVPRSGIMIKVTLYMIASALITLIIISWLRPNQRDFNDEFKSAKGLFGGQVNRALKGEVPSLKEVIDSPQGTLLQYKPYPQISAELCLEKFPKELQPRNLD